MATPRANCSFLPNSATTNADSISVYPVPNNGTFILTINGSTEETIIISIYNSFGKRIYESKELITEKVTEKKINLQPTPPGIYCIHCVYLNNIKKDPVIKKVLIN